MKLPSFGYSYIAVDKPPVDASTPADATNAVSSKDGTAEKYSRIAIANICTALVHLILSLTFLFLRPKMDHGNNNLVRVVSCWDAEIMDAGAEGSDKEIGLDIRNDFAEIGFKRKNLIQFCVVSFHLLSCLFQGIPSALYIFKFKWFQAYMHKTIGQNGAQILRYIEYTFSAPLMIIAIALSFGILEMYTLIGLAVLTAACMQFGLISDILRVHARDLHQAAQVGSKRTEFSGADFSDMRSATVQIMWYLHMVGWVAVSIPWFILMTVYADLRNNSNDEICGLTPGDRISKMPGWVDIIAYGQLILFTMFGLVQAAQIAFSRNSSSATVGVTVEIVFIVLSLTSKALLGATIYMSILF